MLEFVDEIVLPAKKAAVENLSAPFEVEKNALKFRDAYIIPSM